MDLEKSENLFHLTPDFWNSRYKMEETQWDLGEVSPPLKAYFDQIEDKNLPILIPGCGNAHEADYLLKSGFNDITLLDISLLPVNELKKKFKDNPAIKIVLQDFFEHKASYSIIIEQTFFCAIHPSLRKNYALKVNELLKDKGRLVGVLFDRFFENNPPFGGSRSEYETLFKSNFDFHTFSACYNSIPPRAGSEIFINLVKKAG